VRKFLQIETLLSIVFSLPLSLPDFHTTEVDQNFSVIASKTEEIIKSSNDQNVKNSMKTIAERVKSYLKEEEIKVSTCAKETETSTEQESSKEEKQKTQSENSNEEESEVSKMIKETSMQPETPESPLKIDFPEIQKPTKLILDGIAKGKQSRKMTESSTSDENVKKKLKYESPLEFLRLPKNKYEKKCVN
jgi:hypothetical protein